MPKSILTVNLPEYLTYSGDVNPMEHGGMWIDARNWKAPHYTAEIIEIDPLDDSEYPYGVVVCRVLSGYVDADELRIVAAAEFSDCRHPGATPATQAEACARYAGISDHAGTLISWVDVEDLYYEQEQKIAQYVKRNDSRLSHFKTKEEAEAHIRKLIDQTFPKA